MQYKSRGEGSPVSLSQLSGVDLSPIFGVVSRIMTNCLGSRSSQSRQRGRQHSQYGEVSGSVFALG